MASDFIPEPPIYPVSDAEKEEMAKLLDSTRDCPTVPELYQTVVLQQRAPAIIAHVEKCAYCQRMVDRWKYEEFNAHPVEQDLRLYQSGELRGEPLRRVEYHVHSLQCEQCAKKLASLSTNVRKRLAFASLAAAASLLVIIGLQWETGLIRRGGPHESSQFAVRVISDRQDKPLLELVAPEAAHAVVVVTNLSEGTSRVDAGHHLRAQELAQILLKPVKEPSQYVVLFVSGSANEEVPAQLMNDFEFRTRALQYRIHGKHTVDQLRIVADELQNRLRADYPSRALEVMIAEAFPAAE